MATLLVRSLPTQRLPRSLPARRAQPPASRRGAGDAVAHGTSQRHRGWWSPFPRCSCSLPAALSWVCMPCSSPGSRTPGLPTLLSWGTMAGAEHGKCLGPAWWILWKPFLLLSWPGHLIFFFSEPEELAFLPYVCKSLKNCLNGS